MPSPAWSASSATSTSPRRRSRRRSSLPCNGGRRPGSRRAPQAGSSRPPATGRSTACAARRRATTARRRPHWSVPRTTSDSRSGPVTDDRLRLIFTCCHPALAPNVQIALTLRLIAGLQTDEIARAFLVPEPTMAQRLVRAKKKIKAANIPYRVPDRRRAARPAAAGARRRLPRLQRGLRRHRRRRARPRRAVRRGHPPRPAARRAACPTSPRCTACSPCCCSPRRGAPPARPPTARSCGSPTRTGRAGTGELIAEGQAIVAGVPAPRPARAVPDPGRHRRRAQRRGHGRRHRLGRGSSSSTTSCSPTCRHPSSP